MFLNLQPFDSVARQQTCQSTVQNLVDGKIITRVLAKEASLWGPHATAEASIRMGWVDAIKDQSQALRVAELQRARFLAMRYEHVVLLGMGGSTLAPQMYNAFVGKDLVSLDTTHPDAVLAAISGLDLNKTLFIVSSKSGGTVETRSHLAYIEGLYVDNGINEAPHFLVITDPGSELEQYALTKGYEVVTADAAVGGRFSALTVFGLVPATIAAADLETVCADARATLSQLEVEETANPVYQLAAALFESSDTTVAMQVVASDSLELLPAWIAQLVAESTGKDGKGLLPVPKSSRYLNSHAGPIIRLAQTTSELGHGRDALRAATGTTHFEADILATLGQQIVFWQLLTVVLAYLMKVNPYDQPDVETTKAQARNEVQSLIGLTSTANLPTLSDDTIDAFVAQTTACKYLVIQAYVKAPIGELDDLAALIESRTNKAVALSYGPQYLHSTGQLHKGGPKPIGVLQIIEDYQNDMQIPGTTNTYGQIEMAWAKAEREVHVSLGNTVLTARVVNLRS